MEVSTAMYKYVSVTVRRQQHSDNSSAETTQQLPRQTTACTTSLRWHCEDKKA